MLENIISELCPSYIYKNEIKVLPGEVWGWGGEIELAIDVILDKESTWWAAANAEDIIPSTIFWSTKQNDNLVIGFVYQCSVEHSANNSVKNHHSIIIKIGIWGDSIVRIYSPRKISYFIKYQRRDCDFTWYQLIEKH